MDDRLEAVVGNWFARFVANDLDYLDVRRTLDAITDWDDWADAWEATAADYQRAAEAAAAGGYHRTAADHHRRCALTLQFAQFVLTDDPVRREYLHRRQCELYRRAAHDLTPPATAYHRSIGEAEVHGYVRVPAATGPAPAAVLLPGLESTKEQFSTYEPYFLDRGIATVSMEGPGQGEAGYAHRFDLTTYLAAFADTLGWVRSHDGLDPRRVVVVGTSFGGFLALRCAAEAEGLTAVVDIAGPYDLDLGALQPVLQDGFMALVGADDLATAAERLADVTLDGVLDRITVPTLVVHGDDDHVIPVEHGDRIAAALGDRATYDRVAGGSHSCNNRHTLVRPRIADWVADHLHGHFDQETHQ